MDQLDGIKPELFLDRELSWLEFNRRVLDEANNAIHPLLERLKFLAIFSNNLDEFFMIHVPGMQDRNLEESGKQTAERTFSASLTSIKERLEPMLETLSDAYRDITEELFKHDIRILKFSDLHGVYRERLRAHFEAEMLSVLTPLAVDPGHPFPHISNQSISLAVVLRNPDNDKELFARVKIPGKPAMSRLVPVPGHGSHFVLSEDVVTSNIHRLFPGMEIVGCHPFRVTRDYDLEYHEENAESVLGMVEETLTMRRKGALVRLEIEKGMPESVQDRLMEELEARDEQTYFVDGPLNLNDFFSLTNLNFPELRDEPFTPAIPAVLQGGADLFNAILEGDILLHHPYQSFGCVTEFLRKAAEDPQVLTIKHTLYRTSDNSPILKALIQAAENGKQVACLVELKARFDEENNINWAKLLEGAGVHVVYGLPNLKTHSKVTLVVRKEPDGLRRYLHIGTGNYNPKTAAVYTDIGILTCNKDLGADATELFNYLTGYARNIRSRKFLVAPHTLRSRLEEMVRRETDLHSAENPGRIIAKMNALVDPALIKLLYEASQKGVQVDLLIRGMCCLRPGVPGLSENILVRSVIGRFLEHSRIFYFRNGGSEEVYIGSADWMTRNLDRRVEVVAPVEDSRLRKALLEDVLKLTLRDNCQSWDLRPDGSYVRNRPADGEVRFSVQEELLARCRV